MGNFEHQITVLYHLTETEKRSELATALGVLSSAINEWEKEGDIPEDIMEKALKTGIRKKEISIPQSKQNSENDKNTPPYSEYCIIDEYSREINKLHILADADDLAELAVKLDFPLSDIEYWESSKAIPKYITARAEELGRNRGLIPSDATQLDFYHIEASAGNGALQGYEERPEKITFSKRFIAKLLGVDVNDTFLMQSYGDSMQPTLKHKSLIAVKYVRKITEGKVYLFRYDGQQYIKRLQFSKHGLTVISDNSDYEAWKLNKAELASENFQVIGEVIWSGQRM